MIHLTQRKTRRLIRGWAQTGRRFTESFPSAWRAGDDLLVHDINSAAIRHPSGITLILPGSDRRAFRRVHVLADILRRSGVEFFIGSSTQMRNADFTVKEVVSLQWSRGLPLALLKGLVRERWHDDREAYFLSGYDPTEGRRGYFLCELPPARKYNSVAEALETLKPDAVKIAQKAGRKVKRQGDLFFVPMAEFDPTETDTYKKFGETIFEGFIGDTNHAASDLCQTGDAIYVRGVIRHAPDERQPDHKNVRLGRGWHLVARNTVPIEARS